MSEVAKTKAQGPRGYPQALRKEAVRLASEGLAQREIARRIGINHQTIGTWLRVPQPQKNQESVVARRRSTITDVANEAGVSTSTVSNYLNGRGQMGEETRARIEAAIESLQFTPSALVRAVRQRRTGILGVVLFGITSLDDNVGRSITPPLLTGINLAAEAAQYNVLLYPGWPYRQPAQQQGLPFLDGHIDGLLWIAPNMEEPMMERVAQAGLPVLTLLTRHVPPKVGYVNADNVAGIVTAVTHLEERGHQRIAFIGPADGSNYQDRHDGYRQALRMLGLPYAPALEVTLNEDFWDDEHYKQITDRTVDEWFGLPSPPTAVIAANDVLAEWIIERVQTKGKRVPEDVAVIGFDDIPDALRIGGGLTTVHQPFRRIGEVAVERLVAMIGGASIQDCCVSLPTTLVVRGTT